MVVIPTGHHVRLHYGYTPVDGLGWLASALGLAGIVVLARRGEVDFPPRLEEARSPRADRVVVAMYLKLEQELTSAQVGAGYPWVPVDFEPYGYAVPDEPRAEPAPDTDWPPSTLDDVWSAPPAPEPVDAD
jgi:hypothetical protein